MLCWHSLTRGLLLLPGLLSLSGTTTCTYASPSFSTQRKSELRQLIRETWQHGYDSYRRAAFPQDELLPLSCTGQGHDPSNPSDLARNDVCGDYALTLVDALDSFVVFGDHQGFAEAVQTVIHTVSFDKEVKIQVFEATIRVLGGLLSAHLFAQDPKYGFSPHMPWYDGQLLVLARDLGHRLLPAFTASTTGMPYSRIHLKNGVPKDETSETCAAAAGSLMLEFATLSRLTGEPVFERVARKAMQAVWNRRSSMDLLGNSLSVHTGNWLFPQSSIGAGIDSIFEYMVKSYAMLGDEEFWTMWEKSYRAVNRHLQAADGFWYRGVHMTTGNIMSTSVDSLSAFWPGLQVLAGDVEGAVKSHQIYANLWRRYSGLPETYSVPRKAAEIKPYPLRPELIESTLLLYSATNDDSYLRFGERVVNDIVNRTRVDCGLAGILDLETGELEDRMHSFALSETLKYAYLIFDERNFLNLDASNFVYTTEGHPILLPPSHTPILTASNLTHDSRTCPVYDPQTSSKHWSPLASSVDARIDADFGRQLAGYHLSVDAGAQFSAISLYGTCEKPDLESEIIDLLFGPDDSLEDLDPSTEKVSKTSEGHLLVRSIENLRFKLAPRHFEHGTSAFKTGQFDVVKIGPYNVSPKATITIEDEYVWEALSNPGGSPTTRLSFISAHGALSAEAMNAAFGPSINDAASNWASFAGPVHLSRVPGGAEQQLGCEPYSFLPPFDATQSDDDAHQGASASNDRRHHQQVVFVRRGRCTFFQKAKLAAQAGAVGVIVANTDDETTFTPSADVSELASSPLVPLLMINNATSRVVENMLTRTPDVQIKTSHKRAEQQRLVINGYTIANAMVRPPT